MDTIDNKIARIERKLERVDSLNERLSERNKELEADNRFLTAELAVHNKRYSKKRTKYVRKAEIIGYTGTAIGANDIFLFRNIRRWTGDKDGFLGLDMNGFAISKNRDSPGWHKVKITIDILPDEE